MEFKNLAEVTKLDEVPEGASVLAATAEGEVVRVPGDGLGGSGGGADWNAAEGEPGYIANKPFGVSELTWKSVLFEDTVTTEDNGSGADKVFDNAITFESWNGYAIVVDGVTYSYSSPVEGYTAAPYSGVGNASLFDSSKPDTGESFFCYTMWSQTHFRTVEPGAHEVKIGQAATTVSTIDPKCLPYAVVTNYDWLEDDFAKLHAKISAEVGEAYNGAATIACPAIIYNDKFFLLTQINGGSLLFASRPYVFNYSNGIDFEPVIEVENLAINPDGSILHTRGRSAATFEQLS